MSLRPVSPRLSTALTSTLAAGVAGSLLLATAACSVDDADDATGAPTAASAGGSWTVLVYSIADTDLEPFMMDDIVELGEVAGSGDLQIMALVDRAGEYSDADVLGLGDWEGGKLLELDSPGAATVVTDMGDVDTGDPETLAAFVAQGLQDHPADNYALVISDHGASWPGVGGDEGSDYNGLSLVELKQGIGDGLAAAGVERLDLLGFDACLMATYEVASAMAPLADRMLASQELEPGHGWDYTSFAAAADGADVDTLGQAIIDGFQAQAAAEQTDASITLSLVDLTRMGEVDAAVAGLSAALTDRVANLAPAVGRTLAQTLGFGRNADPSQDTHMTDLGILAGELSVESVDIADEAEQVVRALNDVVVARVDGQATRGATGLSIYFPAAQDYYDTSYGDLEVSTGWADFLARYYSVGSDIPAAEQAAFTGDASLEFADGGVYISGEFEPAAEGNISSAYITYGLPTADGGYAIFGDEDSSYEPDGTATVSDFYDLTMLQISDGVDTMDAYLSLGYDSDGLFIFDVPMMAQDADDTTGETARDVTLELGVDPETGDVVSEVYYAQQGGTDNYGEFTPDDNTVMFPLWQFQDSAGESWWAPTEGPGLWADLANFKYEFVPLDAGTEVLLQLNAVDFGGNAASVSASFLVP